MHTDDAQQLTQRSEHQESRLPARQQQRDATYRLQRQVFHGYSFRCLVMRLATEFFTGYNSGSGSRLA
jgi:hypothetical protein